MQLLQNPFIKIIGIIVILYFALFSHKENPASLGNRLSKDRIEKNLSEMQEKGKFIASNVKTARELSKMQASEEAQQNEVNQENVAKSSISETQNVQENVEQNVASQTPEVASKEVVTSAKNLKSGNGQMMALCGMEVEFSTIVKNSVGKIVETKKSEKLILGGGKDNFLEKNILGMHQGGVREIKIPQDFHGGDKKLMQALQKHKSDLLLQVTLMKVSKTSSVGKVYRCE